MTRSAFSELRLSLERVAQAMQAGGAGVIFGRSVRAASLSSLSAPSAD